MNLPVTDLYFDYCQLEPNEREVFLAELSPEQRVLLAKFEQGEIDPYQLVMTSLLGTHAERYFDQEYQLEGQFLGKYRIEKKLGSGGVGVVYSAQRDDGTFSQRLAIKLIKPSLVNVLGHQALFREAQLLARLNHANIAKIYDGEIVDETVFIVMEKVEGEPLDQYLTCHDLKLKQVVVLFDKVCSAIEHAHQRNIIHADIKPENILISELGEPKLIDFNLFADGHEELNHISAYSEGYASPEQVSNEHLTQASDIYSLGKVFSMMFAQPNDELTAIVNKATQTKIEQRYASVSELRVEIQRFLEHKPLSVVSLTPLYLLKKFTQRKPAYVLFMLVATMGIVIFTQLLLYKNHQLKREKAVAESFLVEINELLYYSHSNEFNAYNLDSMLDLTRRKMLSNPEVSEETKAKILASFILPTADKKIRNKEK